MRLAVLLLALPALPAFGQEPRRVPYEDVFFLEGGGVLRGRIEAENDRTVSIREESSGELRVLARADILRRKPREEVYLDEGRAALGRGDLALALDYFQFLVREVGEGEWRAAADRGVESVFYEHTQRGLSIVRTKDGRCLVGEIYDKGIGIVVLVDKEGGPYVSRRDIERILTFDDMLLARGDRLVREGKPDLAAEEYRRLVQRHEKAADEWARTAIGRLGRTYLAMGDQAIESGRIDEGYGFLLEASRLLPFDAEVKARLASAEKVRDLHREERRRTALGLLEEAKVLAGGERYPEALRLVEEAAAAAPWLQEVRDFRRACQDQLLLLVCAEVDLPREFHPLVGPSPAEARAGRLLFESLVDLDEREEPSLDLAESVETSPDDRIHTFRLRPGLVWSDGKPLTSVDVQFSAGVWTHARSERRCDALARCLERVEVLDPLRVRFHLSRRHPRPLWLYRFPILPRHALGASWLDRADPFFRSPVVSGPYVLGEIRENEVVFYKNLRYRKADRPRIYGVVFRRFVDSTAAAQALRRGEVDVWPEVAASAVGGLAQASSEFRVFGYARQDLEVFFFNHRRELLAHANVRRAIDRALPREPALVDRLEESAADRPLRVLASGPFPPATWRSNPDVAPSRHEPAYGRELLRDTLEGMGYRLEVGTPLAWMRGEERLSLSIVYPAGDEGIARACRNLAGGIEEIGIRPVLLALPADEYERRVVCDHDFDLAYHRIRSDDLDDLAALFDPAARGPGGANISGYLDPSLVEQIYALGKTLDPRVAANLHHRVHEILAEDAFACFLWRLERCAATSIRVVPASRHPHDLFRRIENWRLVTFE